MVGTATSTSRTIVGLRPVNRKGLTLSVISLFPRGAFGKHGGNVHTSLTRALTSLGPGFVHFPNNYTTRNSKLRGVCG